MKAEKGIRDYLEHILECIASILEYVADGETSLEDPKTEDAVVRRLQVMAESTLKIPEDKKAAYPEVGWQHIRNFRNRLVHEYLDVDEFIIWNIIKDNLPKLKIAAEAMLHDPDSDNT